MRFNTFVKHVLVLLALTATAGCGVDLVLQAIHEAAATALVAAALRVVWAVIIPLVAVVAAVLVIVPLVAVVVVAVLIIIPLVVVAAVAILVIIPLVVAVLVVVPLVVVVLVVSRVVTTSVVVVIAASEFVDEIHNCYCCKLLKDCGYCRNSSSYVG